MELLAAFVLLVLFDLAALRWGADSRGATGRHPGTGGILPKAAEGSLQ